MTTPPPKFSPKERAAYLAGYRQAHRERIGDLRRLGGDFLAELEGLRAELNELRRLAGRPPIEDQPPKITVQ